MLFLHGSLSLDILENLTTLLLTVNKEYVKSTAGLLGGH